MGRSSVSIFYQNCEEDPVPGKGTWLQKIAKSKRTPVILVHGWEGSSTKNWFPWIAGKLSATKYWVIPMTMPNPNSPKKADWIKHLQDHVEPDSKTIFVAHSIGCMAVLRYLENISDKVDAAILVAPFTENEKKYKTIQSFFVDTLKWDKIKRNCPKIYTIHSDDDPYVSSWQRLPFIENLNATSFVEKGKGHFDGKTLPKILEIVKSL